MRRSAPHSRPAMHFRILMRREQRCLISAICTLNVSRLSNVKPRYLKLCTRGMISPFKFKGVRGSMCRRFVEKIRVADFAGEISTYPTGSTILGFYLRLVGSNGLLDQR